MNGSLRQDAEPTTERTQLLPRTQAPDGEVSPVANAMGRWRALSLILSMWALIFLQASNASGIITAQDAIAADLNSYDNVMWFSSSYLITTASLAPLVGRLSTIFAPRSMILCSSVFFAAGAVVASSARSFGTFILGRVLIGMGGAGIMTLSLIMVLQLVSPRRRGLFVGLINCGFTIGLSTGAVVFGALIGPLGWRALFWAQAPIGLVAGLGVYLSLPGPPVDDDVDPKKQRSMAQKLRSIDYAGSAALILTIVLFLYGLSGATIQLVPVLASVAFLGIFVAWELLVASDPVIPLEVLRSRGILLSCLAQLGFMAARWTVLFYAPIFVLAVRGLSPAVAGSVLIPTNAGFGSGGLVAGLHIRRTGSFWLSCLVSLTVFALALYGMSLVSTASEPAGLYVLVLIINGFATGCALNYTLAHLLHLATPKAETQYVATSLLAAFRGFAGSFGTAIGGGFVKRALQHALSEGFRRLDSEHGDAGRSRQALITKLIGSPALVFGGNLTDAERQVAVAGYEAALRRLYQSAAAFCIIVLLVQASTGWTAPSQPDQHEAEAEPRLLDEEEPNVAASGIQGGLAED